MTAKEKIICLAEENNGILMTKQVTAAGISRYALKEVVEEGKLTNVQRGVYVMENGYVDDFFLLQHKFPKGVYSHETALYLLGFSDRIPMQIIMTFKHGQSTTRMKNENVRPVMITHGFTKGIIEVERSGGTLIRVYNIERTLVDLVKSRYDPDLEQLIPALKRYAIHPGKDINRLYRYAKMFNVEEQIRNYMGVLL